MNGRLYDPLVGRFLSADKYVQDPNNSQCYNRYSYCLNNPLKYNDPSGMMVVPNNPAINAYFMGMQASEFNNSGDGGGSSGDQSGGSDESYKDFWNPLINSISYMPDLNKELSKIIYTGTSSDPYETLRGFIFTDGSSFYFNDSTNGAGEPVGEHNSPMDIGFKINDVADKAGTLTSVNIYGAQKIAGVAAKDMAKLTTMTVIGRVTGVTCIVDNSMKFWENPGANWWNGVEALGQATAITAGWATGVEEIELIYNATTLTIDLTIMGVNKYNQDHP